MAEQKSDSKTTPGTRHRAASTSKDTEKGWKHNSAVEAYEKALEEQQAERPA